MRQSGGKARSNPDEHAHRFPQPGKIFGIAENAISRSDEPGDIGRLGFSGGHRAVPGSRGRGKGSALRMLFLAVSWPGGQTPFVLPDVVRRRHRSLQSLGVVRRWTSPPHCQNPRSRRFLRSSVPGRTSKSSPSAMERAGLRSRLATSTAMYGRSVEHRRTGRFCEGTSGQREHIVTQPTGFTGRGSRVLFVSRSPLAPRQ